MKNWQLFQDIKADPAFQPRLLARLDYPYGDGVNEEEELPKHLKRAKEVASLNRNKLRAIHVAQSLETPFRPQMQERNPLAVSQASIDDRRHHQTQDLRGYPDQASASPQPDQETALRELREWQEFQEFKARKRDFETNQQQLADQASQSINDPNPPQDFHSDAHADRYPADPRHPSHQQPQTTHASHHRQFPDHPDAYQQAADSMHRQQPSTHNNFDFSPEEIEHMRQKIIDRELERLAREEAANQQPASPHNRQSNQPPKLPPRRPDDSAPAPEYRSRDESLDKNRSDHLKQLNSFYGEFMAEQHKRRQPFTKDDFNYLMSVKHMKRNGIL